jgi:hypothetical protein
MKLLINVSMMDASKALEAIPNLDAKFSFLPYKFCDDGPTSDRAQLFSCMLFVHDGITHKNILVPLYAGQMTKEDSAVFMDLFKLKRQSDGAIQDLQLFLQKYSTTRDQDGWDRLAQDVEFVGPVEELDLCDLEYQLAVHVQDKTPMGVITTNGQHHTGKGILVRGIGRKPMEHCMW